MAFLKWLLRNPQRDIPYRESSAEFVMTGPELTEKIANAIRLNQSVVLIGPRGCGKSRCINHGIRDAIASGFLVDGAHRFLQGNREIPRDYLIEDEVIFRPHGKGTSMKVVPERNPSPVFGFALRKPDGLPETFRNGNGEEWVKCQLDPNLPIGEGNPEIGRFVLFLDEINRFSDGVLDSLLSILEERKTVMSGKEYFLPIVVCMTMNPPGYDATARRLNPPLAARITRTYRLYTPDLDTLTDQIVAKRLEVEHRRYEEYRKLRKKEHPEELHPDWPPLDPRIVRKVALVTLCLWGLPRAVESTTKPEHPGMEYLTVDTRKMLIELANSDASLLAAMKELQALCHFGPDGRAAGDWIATAIDAAINNAKRRGDHSISNREVEDFLNRTVIETIANKIYDKFSPASRPELTVKKETILRLVARLVLHRNRFPDCGQYSIIRTVDEPDRLNGMFKTITQDTRLNSDSLSKLFIGAGLTKDAEVEQWAHVFDSYDITTPQSDRLNSLTRKLVELQIVVDPGSPAQIRSDASRFSSTSNGRASSHHGWSNPKHEKFAIVMIRKSGQIYENISFLKGEALDDIAKVFHDVLGVLQTEQAVLSSLHSVCLVSERKPSRKIAFSPSGFIDQCNKKGVTSRFYKTAIANHLESLWNNLEEEAVELETNSNKWDYPSRFYKSFCQTISENSHQAAADGLLCEFIGRLRDWIRWQGGPMAAGKVSVINAVEKVIKRES